VTVIDLEGATVVLDPAQGRLGFAIAPHGVRVRTSDAVAWVVVESGHGTLTADNETVETSPRNDVFGGVGWSAFAGRAATLTADEHLRCLIVWRAYDGDAETRVISPSDVQVEDRGTGTFARTVRTYLPEGPLIAGETINPPGGWSSYPPHRHDDFEEAYLYRFSPASGFGLAAQYDATGETSEANIVRDGDVTRIPHGYHPVVAAPGYAMAYTWALAGDTTFAPTLDPAHDWVS
jgi:5-deoxy-glucuronate isomerase